MEKAEGEIRSRGNESHPFHQAEICHQNILRRAEEGGEAALEKAMILRKEGVEEILAGKYRRGKQSARYLTTCKVKGNGGIYHQFQRNNVLIVSLSAKMKIVNLNLLAKPSVNSAQDLLNPLVALIQTRSTR